MPLAKLPLALLVGTLGGLGGVLFNKSLTTSQRLGQNSRIIPRWCQPGIAGFTAGILAWRIPEVLGGGQLLGERLLSGALNASLTTLAILMVFKFLLTALSYGSGAPGGIFAPMLLLGALLGAMVAKFIVLVMPTAVINVQLLAVLGMAAFFVGSVRAPLTGIVLISEMTDGYELLFPICIACLAAYLIAEGLKDHPIYDALLEADLARTGHGSAHEEPRTVYIGVQIGSAVANQTVAKAGLPQGCLLVSIERAGNILLPEAKTILLPGDHLSILTAGDRPDAPLEIVKLCTGL